MLKMIKPQNPDKEYLVEIIKAIYEFKELPKSLQKNT